ncbi:MAG TPA: Hpt domain-containing protein [Stellaceae bacterium]|jgi:HPt (histidine-containing phosphotransfer) domain-containing protein
MSDTPLINVAILDDMIEYIGLDALRPVIELFMSESRSLSATITAGANDPAQRDAVRRAAHSLKSSAGQLGGAALSEAAAELERAAESGAPLDTGAALVARLAEATAFALTERLKRPG